MAVSDRRHDDDLAFQQLDAFLAGEDSRSPHGVVILARKASPPFRGSDS